MRQSLVVVFMVLMVAGMASAQDLSKVELFGGYSVLIFSGKDVTTLQGTVASHYGTLTNAYYSKFFKKGGTFSAAYNLNDNLAVEANATYNVGDILRAEGQSAIGGPKDIKSRLRVIDYSIFLGPRYSYEMNKKIKIFAHVMAGANRFSLMPSLTVGGAGHTAQLGVPYFHDDRFAIKGGAGFDVTVKKNIAIRPFQIDFIWASGNLPPDFYMDLSLKNINLSAGVVYHLPGKK
jgi:hypothetical protein